MSIVKKGISGGMTTLENDRLKISVGRRLGELQILLQDIDNPMNTQKMTVSPESLKMLKECLADYYGNLFYRNIEI